MSYLDIFIESYNPYLDRTPDQIEPVLDGLASVFYEKAIKVGYSAEQAQAKTTKFVTALGKSTEDITGRVFLRELIDPPLETVQWNSICTGGQIADKFIQTGENILFRDAVCKQAHIPFSGFTSRAYREEFLTSFYRVPIPVRKFLRLGQAIIRGGATSLDIQPRETGKIWDVSEEDKRTHLNHSGGLYDSTIKTAWVSEFYLSADEDQYDTPLNFLNLLLDKWTQATSIAVAVYHEAGHAFSHVFANFIYNEDYMTNSCVHNLPGFIAAYEADLEKLGGYDAAREKGYKYYVRKDKDLSRDETSAQLTAAHFSNTPHLARMKSDWPASYGFLNKFYADFCSAYREGVIPFLKFIYSLSVKPPEADGMMTHFYNSRMAQTINILCQDKRTTSEDIKLWVELNASKTIAIGIQSIIENLHVDKKYRFLHSALVVQTILTLPIIDEIAEQYKLYCRQFRGGAHDLIPDAEEALAVSQTSRKCAARRPQKVLKIA